MFATLFLFGHQSASICIAFAVANVVVVVVDVVVDVTVVGNILSPVLGLLRHVPLHVQGQVVGPGKASLAHPALERLGPGVLPVVPGQFVRSCEAPLTVREVASVRLFT